MGGYDGLTGWGRRWFLFVSCIYRLESDSSPPGAALGHLERDVRVPFGGVPPGTGAALYNGPSVCQMRRRSPIAYRLSGQSAARLIGCIRVVYYRDIGSSVMTLGCD